MAILTVYQPVPNGTTISFVAAAGGGDSFPNTGKELFHAINGSGSPITITFDSPGACNFGVGANAAHDAAGAVPAGGQRVYGPFPPGQFNDPNGRAQVTYSGVVTLTVGVVAGGG